MSYTITRENAARDLEALKAILDNDGIVEGDVKVLEEIADSIEEQVKPAVEEPLYFGSIVIAGGPLGNRMRWQRTPMHGKHYWESETGAVDVWSDLHNPVVLRVGIGEPVNGLRQQDGSPKPSRFCTNSQNCRMADGHDGGCRVS